MSESHALARIEVGAIELSDVEVSRQAGLLQQKWGTSMKLSPEDWKGVVGLAVASGMNPVFDLDILNGQLYDKSDFWKGLLAGHPNVEYVSDPVWIQYGTQEWDDMVRISDPDVVACACYLEVKLRDRTRPIRAGQYVKKADPILWASEKEGTNFGTATDAKEKAKAYAGEHGKVYWVAEKDAKPWEPKGWWGKKGSLLPDWEGLAGKKCATTVFRRIGKIAVPRAHARVLAMIDKVSQLEEQSRRLGAGAVPAAPADPYSKPEVGGAPSGTISEKDRKTLMAIAHAKGLDRSGVLEIHRTSSKLPSHQELHLSDLTYADMEAIVTEIDKLPIKEHEVTVEKVAAVKPKPAEQPKPPASDEPPESFDLWPK